MLLKFLAQQESKVEKLFMNTTKEVKTNVEGMTNKNRLVTERVAASIIGVSYESLKRSIRWTGRIPFYRVNKRISYKISDLEEFLQQCRVPAK
jgi:hypothetical protein